MCGHSGHGLPARSRHGRLRHQLELMDAQRALPVRGAQAVRPGVAAADDDDVLAVGGDEVRVHDRVTLAAAVLLRQVVHREMDALQLAAGHRQVARRSGAARQQHRVEVALQAPGGQIHADVHAGLEDHALRFQDRQTAIEEALLHLELGDAVAQQATDAVRLLVDGHRVAGAVQLIGRSEAGGPGPDDRHPLHRAVGRRPWAPPSLRPMRGR